MNKRDAMNQIRQFSNRFDRFRKPQGGGDGNRNAPKRAKAAPKPNSRKTNVFNEQVRYAFRGALQDLKSKPLATFLTVMVIAISPDAAQRSLHGLQKRKPCGVPVLSVAADHRLSG